MPASSVDRPLAPARRRTVSRWGRALLGQFPSPVSALIASFAVALTLLGFAFLVSSTGYDIWGAAIAAPVLIALSIPLLVRQSIRDNDRRLLMILVVGLVLKLLTGLVYYLVTLKVYGGAADAFGYHEAGTVVATHLRSGNLLEAIQQSISYRGGDPTSPLTSLLGTRAMPLIVGVVYAVMGPSLLGGFLVFSWLGFLGSFLFYRGFRIALPEGNHHLYAVLLFFLPSMLFWSSTIGKEAWLLLGLGLVAVGAARSLMHHIAAGLLPLVSGFAIVGVVRIHIAALVGISLVIATLFRRLDPNLKELRPVLKTALFAVFLIGGLFLFQQARSYLGIRGLSTDAGFAAALSTISERTSEAGSDFAAVVVRSPVDLPPAAVTVLFRPFPFEATNALAATVALEATFLAVASLVRIRAIAGAVRSLRTQPYVAFALLATVVFIVGFSSFGNFGLLARQRVQMLPFYLVLLAIPAVTKKDAARNSNCSRAIAGSTRSRTSI